MRRLAEDIAWGGDGLKCEFVEKLVEKDRFGGGGGGAV